jgi:hypothetical protein
MAEPLRKTKLAIREERRDNACAPFLCTAQTNFMDIIVTLHERRSPLKIVCRATKDVFGRSSGRVVATRSTGKKGRFPC